LKKRWSIGGLVGVTGTPAVAGGVAYFDDWTGAVRAVQAATGRPLWTTKIVGEEELEDERGRVDVGGRRTEGLLAKAGTGLPGRACPPPSTL
jgi:hypothetical protein